jgi:hypothetical protein
MIFKYPAPLVHYSFKNHATLLSLKRKAQSLKLILKFKNEKISISAFGILCF